MYKNAHAFYFVVNIENKIKETLNTFFTKILGRA